MSKKNSITVRMLAFCGISIAIAFVLSNIRLFRMPSGGSVTLLSMLFITILGWFYGPVAGLTSAFAYSMLQFFTNPYMVSFWQVMFDYIFAFTALGLSGFLRDGKWSLAAGYIAGILGRFVFSSLASILFWTDYTEVTFLQGLWAAALYNGAYIGTEGAITLAVLFIPAVRRSLQRVKGLALKEK